MSLDLPTAAQARARLSAKWNQDESAIGAWVAEMDYGTSAQVRQALHRVVSDGSLGYLPRGLPRRVRQAARDYYAQVLGWDFDLEAIGLAPDVLTVLERTITNLSAPDSPVVVPTPAYMPFLTIPGRLGRQCLQVEALRDTGGGFYLDLPKIRQCLEPRGGTLVLCNPWNPVGRVFSPGELRDLDQALEGLDRVIVFSDEIHSPLTQAGTFHAYGDISAQASARTITATAASKGWNVPGLRCAQWIVPDLQLRQRAMGFLKPLGHEALLIGCVAAIAAFNDSRPWVDQVLSQVQANARMLRQWAGEQRSIDGAPLVGVWPSDGSQAGTGRGASPDQERFDAAMLRVTLPSATYLSWWEDPGHLLGSSPAQTLQQAGLLVNDGATLGQGLGHCFRLNLACSPTVLTDILGIISRAIGAQAATRS